MNILFILGKDVHYGRIFLGFAACHASIAHLKDVDVTGDIYNRFYDIIFIDSSANLNKYDFNCNHIIFFDTEDDPRHFNPGSAYYNYKEQVKFYAKMNYVPDDRLDGIKNIAIPLNIYTELAAATEFKTKFDPDSFMPYLRASPTYIGKYKMIPYGKYSKDLNRGIFSLGIHESGDILYNQRVDWILSLDKHKIKHDAGIVFSTDNCTIDWQEQYFGRISELKANRVNWYELIVQLGNKGIGLCPTGHERMSWRLFDIMSIGSILVWTDNHLQTNLYMPKEFITVKDGEELGPIIGSLNLKETWDLHQSNRDVLRGLTPKRMLDDFMDQLS